MKSLLILLPLLFASEAIAQSFLPKPKTFMLTKNCNVTTSISGKNPIAISSGTALTAVAENNIPGSHAYVEGSGFSNRRWIALTCGTYGAAPISAPGTPANPFFNNINNPVSGLAFGSPADVTPPAPVVNAFDAQVVKLCAAPGTVVSRDQFKTLLNNNPTVLSNIQSTVGFLVAGRTTTAQFLDDLTNIWFASKGF